MGMKMRERLENWFGICYYELEYLATKSFL